MRRLPPPQPTTTSVVDVRAREVSAGGVREAEEVRNSDERGARRETVKRDRRHNPFMRAGEREKEREKMNERERTEEGARFRRG